MNEQRIRIWYTTRGEELVYPIDLQREHRELYGLLRKAYSVEKAAALGYQGHAASVKDPLEKKAIRQIELDEWEHRETVLGIMKKYGVPVSIYYELKYRLIGKFISKSCRLIGWFMPFYFAGKLESKNVCEYYRIMQGFHSLGVHNHDRILYTLSMKEKEHERYCLNKIRHKKVLPLFEKLFSWGRKKSTDHLNFEKKYGIWETVKYCKS
jgi:hypothetical protein